MTLVCHCALSIAVLGVILAGIAVTQEPLRCSDYGVNQICNQPAAPGNRPYCHFRLATSSLGVAPR